MLSAREPEKNGKWKVEGQKTKKPLRNYSVGLRYTNPYAISVIRLEIGVLFCLFLLFFLIVVTINYTGQ